MREVLLSSAKSWVMQAATTSGDLVSKESVQHFVEKNILNNESRNSLVIEAATQDNGVVGFIIVPECLATCSGTP